MAFKQYRKGQEVGIIALKNAYDQYAPSVLTRRLKIVDRHREPESGKRRRAIARYNVVEDLPSQQEYIALRDKFYQTTLEGIVSDAYSEIDELASEMREWHDGMGENLQCSSNGEAVGEAADALENCQDQPDIPESIEDLELTFLPCLKITSRAARASEAASMLRDAASRIEGHIESSSLSQEDEDDFQGIVDHMVNHADELETVSFPGMYG